MKHILRSTLLMLFLAMSYNSIAQTPSYIYFVPLPEQQIHNAFTVLYASTGTTYHTVVSIVPSTTNQKIYFDHWEDGYEASIGTKTQTTTQIWGDGNATNGIPPGYAKDSIRAGKPIILENDVTLPRSSGTIKFDGRDKFGSAKSLAVSRSSWATNPGTVLADATEFYNTKSYGNLFYFPIGQTTIAAGPDNSFTLVSVCVQASQNATTVNIDKGDGSPVVSSVINEGESFQVNGGIRHGGSVTSSKPVQVVLITGKIGGTYASRWYNILPFFMWDKAYYTPVGKTNANSNSDVFIYNPQLSNLTVNYQTNSGTGSWSIPSKSVQRFSLPMNSSAHFHSTLPFYAVGGTDMDAAGNLTWDWGYTLIPELFLTNSIICGWGPGSYGLASNGNPVWVGSTEDVGSTTVYVDLDGDPTTGPLTDANGEKYNFVRIIPPYGMTTIYDNTDNDQTGMHVYTLDGKNIVGAWGEDALTAGPGVPFLDVGTTIPPDPDFVIKKKYKFITDNGVAGQADVGDVIQFKLMINNYTLQPYTDIFVIDSLPSQVSYVANTTNYDLIPLPDYGSGDPFPLRKPTGYYISMLPAGAKDSIYFNVTVTAVNSFYIMNNAWAYDNFGNTYRTNVRVPANYVTSSCSAFNFKDGSGTTVTTYNENSTIRLTITDADRNSNPVAIDSVQVTVTASSGDVESFYLLETGITTGIFGYASHTLTSSKSLGAGNNNGTLFVQAGATVSASYTDPIHADVCSAGPVGITGPSFRKPLYLSDSVTSQNLDRIKPPSTDVTAANTSIITPAGGSGSVTYSTVSSNVWSTAASSRSVSHTTAVGTDRFMIVGVSYKDPNDNRSISTVYYGSQQMSQLTTRNKNNNGNKPVVDFYYLIAPNQTTADVTVTWNNSVQAQAIGVITFTGVHQTTPLGTPSSSTGNATAPSLTLSSASDEIIVDLVSWDNNPTVAANLGQAERWNLDANPGGGSDNDMRSGGSTKTGASSVTVGWSDENVDWAYKAVAVKPSSNPGNPTATFTQATAMCSDIILPSGGQVYVKLWLTNMTGTLVSNPTISAILRDNGTGFLTLTNPTLTDLGSGNGTLEWTGSMGSLHTLAQGHTLSLVVTTTQASFTYQITYDAFAVPSMVRLPATNVIDVTSFGVYTAPYNGGSLTTTALNGTTVYVRSTVTDPFGAYDITSDSLFIYDPASGLTKVKMTQVNETGCTRTYEYAWLTGSTQGIYTLKSIASEGWEGEVKDTAQTTFELNYLDTGTPCTIDFTDNTYNTGVTQYAVNGTIYLKVQDLDQNTNPSTTQSFTVTVTSSTGDVESNITVTETGNNTGIFTGSRASSNSGTSPGGVNNNNGTIYAVAGSTLVFSYTDPDNPGDVCTDNAFIPTGTNSISIIKERILPTDFYAVIGDTVRWRIVITNTGTNPTTGLSLTDTVSSTCLNFVSASPTQTSNVVTTVRTLTWDATALGGQLAAGANKTIITTYTVAQGCGVRANRATVTNTAASPTTATDTSRVGLDNPVLTITKTRISPVNVPVYVGDLVKFRIVVTNSGNTNATTVPLADLYSDYNFSYVSPAKSVAENSYGGGQVNWTNIGTINAGSNWVDTVSFTALHGNEGSYVVNNAGIDFAFDAHGNPYPSVNDSARLYIFSPPVAINDTVTTLKDVPVTGTVMENDYDDDGDVIVTNCSPQLYPQSGTTANGGTYVINNDGTYTYTPASGFTGTDSFNYQICDPTGATDNAKVVIHIVSCIDPPARPDNVH